MNAVHILALVLLIGYLGERAILGRLRIGGKTRHLFLLGGEFIALGALLGPRALNVLSEPVLLELRPVLAMGIGWLGLLLGLQFSKEHLRRFPEGTLFAAFGLPVAVAALSLPLLLVLFRMLGPFSSRASSVLVAGIVLAVATSCTSPTSIALMTRSIRTRVEVAYLLRIVSALDGLPGLLALGLLYGVLQARIGPVAGVAVAIGAPTALALLFFALLRQLRDPDELIVIVLGVITFAGGAAFSARVSSLFSTLVVGVLLAQMPVQKRTLSRVLASTERPFYIVFLILAGAQWDFASLRLLAFGLAYVVLRALVKVAVPAFSGLFLKNRGAMPPHFGLGLLGQGGLSLAIALEYDLLFPGELSDAVLAAVIVAVMANQVLAPAGLRLLLGEASSRPPRREELLA